MRANIIKRVLSGALALSLVLAPSVGVMASEAGTVAGAAAAETVTEAFPNVKESYTVGGIKSSINGVFLLEKGIGVATVADSAAIAASYSLPNGARAYVKAYDMDVKRSNLAKACMDAAAAAYGAEAFGYINFELGMMQGGKYSLLSGGNGVDAVLSIPGKNLVAGANYGVICVQEGGVITILRDATPGDGVISVTLPAGRCALALVKF
ncbi:MAG: hypothetical protein IJP31_05605 [Lachnospiraceae bacterium]|nr:hypothetical protein [Lachnospiraceae bacterium]